MQLNVEFKFAAAHRLPRYDGPCNRMHGHNYRFVVTFEGEPDPKTGMVLDFTEVEKIVKHEILEVVDHQTLNDFLENPTAELIAIWFWERLQDRLPGLAEITLWEMDNCSVSYRGPRGS